MVYNIIYSNKMSTPPIPPIPPQPSFDQIVEGNIDIKQLSKNKYNKSHFVNDFHLNQ